MTAVTIVARLTSNLGGASLRGQWRQLFFSSLYTLSCYGAFIVKSESC